MTPGTATVGWIVDSQVDFLDPTGRLYVRDLGDDCDPGAMQIIPKLEQAVAWMDEHCDVMVFTGDWHGVDDAEIDPVSPDPMAGTYPPHCMGRSDDPAKREGAAIIPQIRPEGPIVLEIGARAEDAQTVATRAVAEGRPIFIHKNRFDVFVGNAATEALLVELASALEATLAFVVVGVARDVCVTQVVDGLQARGYRVTALSDATWGLGLEDEAVTLRRWREHGSVMTLEELRISGAAWA